MHIVWCLAKRPVFCISQAGHYCKLMYLLKSVHYAICFLDTLDQESCNVNLFPIVWKHFQLCTLGLALSLSAIGASVRCLLDVPLSAHIAYLQIQHLVLDSCLSAAPLAPICSICTWQGLVACDDLSSCYLQYSSCAITNTDAQTQIQMGNNLKNRRKCVHH